MSRAPLPHQHISRTSATNGGIAVAGVLSNVVINTRESSRPPKPSSTVPFRRDRDFVDRGDLLSRVNELCSQPAGRAALVGLGGVGKSQLAIEHTYRTKERSPDTWVFWVHASNAARFEQGYRYIADVVRIAGREDPKANIFRVVHDWLRGCEGKWLLILDNVDNTNLLSEAVDASLGRQGTGVNAETQQPMTAYLPQSQNGSILVTSRSQAVALKLVEEEDIIAVQPMSESHALTLFEKKLGVMGEGNHIAELAAALEFMPLAIVQAAAYISQRAPRCSVWQYLEDFRKSDRWKTSLLNYEGGQLRRDWEAKNSIIITWQISFEHIHRTWQSAADLLSLMSFFDRQGIPEPLVRGRARAGCEPRSWEERYPDDGQVNSNEDDGDGDSISESDKDDGFEEDVRILRDYSFIYIETDRTFEMHALVQVATRWWLEVHGQSEQWKHQFIRNLAARFPAGDHQDWTTCQALFPHAKAALVQRPQAEVSLRAWASLLYHAAWYAFEKGSNGEAIDMSRAASDVQKKLIGQEHKETLSSLGIVGLAYGEDGRWNEAEELQVQVMEICKRVLGKGYPDTLNSMANLAITYKNQGRLKEAEELEVQVIETTQRALGEEYLYTLTGIFNLAVTYRKQGRLKEAEELEVRVTEKRKRVLGEEDPSTLFSIESLASIYRNQGRLKEAEELEIQVLEIRKRVLGKEHPHTLDSIANLASTYWSQGRWKEAEELGVQVTETRKRVLGEEDPRTLFSMANLALTYWSQGRWKEAEELGVQVTETRKRVLGEEHPETLTTIANLALTYRSQGYRKEAEELEVRVIEIRKRVLGEEHPSTLSSINNFTFILKDKGEDEKAIALMEECVGKRKQVLGQDHPFTKASEDTLSRWRIEGLHLGSLGRDVNSMAAGE